MIDKQLIAAKKSKLEQARINLKSYFVGIDDAIDQIISKIEIWWCYPEFLTRPTIINLFSLTGSGKTDLVRRLSEELGIQDKYTCVELNNCKSDSPYGKWGEDSILFKLYDAKIKTSDQAILLLDEIQHYRSILNTGGINKINYYNDMWRLLSDGRLGSNQERIRWFKDTMYKLNERVSNNMLNAANASINKPSQMDMNDALSVMMKSENIPESNMPQVNQHDTPNEINTDRLLSYIDFTEEDEQFIWNLKYMLQSPKKIMMDKIRIDRNPYMKNNRLIDSISNFMILQFMEKKFDEIMKNTNEDDDDSYVYSKLLVFISGNLDNLFTKKDDLPFGVNQFEQLRSHTESITADMVKKELHTMFNPEQISRLGNNYIIYKSLTEDDFRTIVKQDVKRSVEKINKKYHTDIHDISDEVYDAVKSIGIYPSQGVRPVYSTIASVMGDIIPKLLIEQAQ